MQISLLVISTFVTLVVELWFIHATAKHDCLEITINFMILTVKCCTCSILRTKTWRCPSI